MSQLDIKDVLAGLLTHQEEVKNVVGLALDFDLAKLSKTADKDIQKVLAFVIASFDWFQSKFQIVLAALAVGDTDTILKVQADSLNFVEDVRGLFDLLSAPLVILKKPVYTVASYALQGKLRDPIKPFREQARVVAKKYAMRDDLLTLLG